MIDTITLIVISQPKCLEERKQDELYLAIEVSGIVFFSTNLEFFESKVGKASEVFLRTKDLKN